MEPCERLEVAEDWLVGGLRLGELHDREEEVMQNPEEGFVALGYGGRRGG